MAKTKVRMLIRMENEEYEALSANFKNDIDVDPKKVTRLAYGNVKAKRNG